MEVDEAFAALPDAYARVLWLRAEGAAVAEIASCMGVPREAADTLIRVGEAKLARLRASLSDLPTDG